MPASSQELYEISMTLLYIEPPIWRRFQAPKDIDLTTLHMVLQNVMGWENYHIYHFMIGGKYYGQPSGELEMEDAAETSLDRVAKRVGSRFGYEYDFGDSWEHELRVEKRLKARPGKHYPVCVAGERACPPEDCGGEWGYAELLETLQDPGSDEYDEMLEWVGGSFDPEAFDIQAVNQRLKRLR